MLHKRSIIKSLTWRVISTIATISLIFFSTDNLKLSLNIGGLDIAIKLIIYYIHERFWEKI